MLSAARERGPQQIADHRTDRGRGRDRARLERDGATAVRDREPGRPIVVGALELEVGFGQAGERGGQGLLGIRGRDGGGERDDQRLHRSG